MNNFSFEKVFIYRFFRFSIYQPKVEQDVIIISNAHNKYRYKVQKEFYARYTASCHVILYRSA